MNNNLELKEGDTVYKYELDGMHCDLVLGTVRYPRTGWIFVHWDDDTLDLITEDLEIYKLNK